MVSELLIPSLYMYIYVFMYVHMWVYVFVYTWIYIYMCVGEHVSLHVHVEATIRHSVSSQLFSALLFWDRLIDPGPLICVAKPNGQWAPQSLPSQPCASVLQTQAYWLNHLCSPHLQCFIRTVCLFISFRLEGWSEASVAFPVYLCHTASVLSDAQSLWQSIVQPLHGGGGS